MKTEDHSTPGPWWVRMPARDGEIVDAFVCAPDVQGYAYDAEILGDDEYRDEKGDGSGIRRKIADCQLIVRLVNEHREAIKSIPESIECCRAQLSDARAAGWNQLNEIAEALGVDPDGGLPLVLETIRKLRA